VAVEGSGAAHERHQAIGPRQREESVNVLVGETLGNA
jgi:hypothetical protein